MKHPLQHLLDNNARWAAGETADDPQNRNIYGLVVQTAGCRPTKLSASIPEKCLCIAMWPMWWCILI